METIQSQVDELIAQMTPAEKAGQLTQYFYFRLPADAAPALDFDADAQPKIGRVGVAGGRRGFTAVRHRSGRDQPPPTARDRRQPPRHPGAVRFRRHPRAAHDSSGADRDGGLVGSRRRSSAASRSPPARRVPWASTGRSRRWSTSPAIHVGAGSSRALEKIRTSARPWPSPRCAASRAVSWVHPTASSPVRSTSPVTGPRSVGATTTRSTSPTPSSGTCTSRRSRRRSRPVPAT